jgi:glycosyltransferase involved in cell wall biosynthesis
MPSRLHVGLNLAFLTPGRQGGMEIYAREIIRRLAERDDLRLTALVNYDAYGSDWGKDVREVLVPVRASDRKQWVAADQFHVPRLARGCDVVHSLASTSPAVGRFRRVTTIHDIMYKLVPDAHSKMLGYGLGALVRLAAHRSHRIICGSQATAGDLVRHLGVAPGKIDVIPYGVNPQPIVTPTGEGELRSRLGLGTRPVILSVSPKRPSKNLERLIRAHARLPQPRPVLVMPGYSTPYEAVLRSVVAEMAVEPDVRFLGWVSDEDLEGLYALASVMAFPSLYEGFGLPPLEAMARGVPVVCSGRGALAEVVGDAALLVDPESVDAIASGLLRVLSDDSERKRLAAAGRRRVPEYSWDRSARMTVITYRSALAGISPVFPIASGDRRRRSAPRPLPSLARTELPRTRPPRTSGRR